MAKALIVYDTNIGTTEKMAKDIEKGLKEAGIDVVSKMSVSATVEDLKDVDAVVLGCPTYFDDISTTIKLFMIEMKKAELKGKVGAAFGGYGLGGESIQIMTDTMKHLIEMDVLEPGLKFKATEIMLGKAEKGCKEFGNKIAKKIKEKGGK